MHEPLSAFNISCSFARVLRGLACQLAAMDPDGMTTDQLRRWAEAMSTVGLQQVVQICREELQQRAQNNPSAWNAPCQTFAAQQTTASSGNTTTGASPSPSFPSVSPEPGPTVRIKCQLRCANPACHRRCKRSGHRHRDHFCRPCHDAGWG